MMVARSFWSGFDEGKHTKEPGKASPICPTRLSSKTQLKGHSPGAFSLHTTQHHKHKSCPATDHPAWQLISSFSLLDGSGPSTILGL